MIRRLELDFCAPRPRLRYLGWALLAAGIIASTLSYGYYRHVEDESQIAEAGIRGLMRGTHSGQPPALTSSDTEALRKQLHAASDVMRRLVLPWERLFMDIEAASNESIALLSIEPDPLRRQVRIGGEARSAGVLADYVDRLEATASLDNVHISQHELRDEQGAPSIRFALLASWRDSR